MTIEWKKYKTEYKSLKDRYSFKEGEIFTGLVSTLSENQSQDTLEKFENITGTIESIPFVSFSITPTNIGFKLTSRSEISLKDYKPLDFKLEEWGECESSTRCKNKAMSVIKGFTVYLGTGKINDGECYKY
jgi:chaperone required for assembly of F1-ATPase